jgi:head-tail adaptor
MHKIFLPYGTDVTEKDRITMGLSVYEVEFVNPDAGGEGHHVEVLVKETKA